MRVMRLLAIVMVTGLGATACCLQPTPPSGGLTLADLNGSFAGTSTLEGSASCTSPPVHSQDLDAVYAVANAANEVHLHVPGCVDPGTGTWDRGTFTIATDVGTIQGSASGSIVGTSGGFGIELDLTVTSGTGDFAGEMGTMHLSVEWNAIALGVTPITGSLTAV